jgi:hypothetical protein
MVARLVAALAVVGVVACGTGEKCAHAACGCATCPQVRLSEADSGSTVDYPQGYRVEVPASLTASDASGGTLTVTDARVLLVQPSSPVHALQFVTGMPGRARVSVTGTSFEVDVVVHRWPFGLESAGDKVLNPYDPVPVTAKVGDEFGILFYTSPGGPTTVVSDDNQTVQVLDTFTASGVSGEGHFGVFRAVGQGRATVTVTCLGGCMSPARSGPTPLLPIGVTVASP